MALALQHSVTPGALYACGDEEQEAVIVSGN